MIAPGRAARPGAGGAALDAETPEELEACPFCGGREDRTPPETLVLPGPDWRVRVVPNLYPAFERQEVVIHSRRHVRQLADLAGEELDLVAEAWRRRRREVPDGYLHALVNEGRLAGSSLPHSHSQLVWLPGTPPGNERDWARVLEGEAVLERGGLVLLCPPAPRLPYELRIAPAEPEAGAFVSGLLAPALRLLAEAAARIRALEGPRPLNAWLVDGEHWHLELLPRLTVMAGLELGAGIYLNTLPPEEAAARLRNSKGRS